MYATSNDIQRLGTEKSHMCYMPSHRIVGKKKSSKGLSKVSVILKYLHSNCLTKDIKSVKRKSIWNSIHFLSPRLNTEVRHMGEYISYCCGNLLASYRLNQGYFADRALQEGNLSYRGWG